MLIFLFFHRPDVCALPLPSQSADEVAIMNVGKRDPKRHLEADAEEVMAANVVQSLGTMLNTIIF